MSDPTGLVQGKLEVVVKISDFPKELRTTKDGWKEFDIATEGDRVVTATFKPKNFKKLEEAQASWPLWTAVINGKIGPATPRGFVIAEPGLQVFERKPKEPKDAKPT